MPVTVLQSALNRVVCKTRAGFVGSSNSAGVEYNSALQEATLPEHRHIALIWRCEYSPGARLGGRPFQSRRCGTSRRTETNECCLLATPRQS